ncbi:transposase [Streptomyces sp. NPDC001292]|uniref:transposase n=1 Tax=Streptomyces sp. NPDC001292 TaxID=3364558 RepID=UPI0036CD170E
MNGKSNTSKRYTPEFKRDAVALVRSWGRNITEVAREFGVSPEALRGWVKQAKVDRGEGPAGALTSYEKEELRRLRRENRGEIEGTRSKLKRLVERGWLDEDDPGLFTPARRRAFGSPNSQ